MYNSVFEDAFLKLREQIVTYQHSSDQLLKGGLNLVNSSELICCRFGLLLHAPHVPHLTFSEFFTFIKANLSFFNARQKSELFRLKAYFLNALHDKPKSNQAYCHAVQICPTYAR